MVKPASSEAFGTDQIRRPLDRDIGVATSSRASPLGVGPLLLALTVGCSTTFSFPPPDAGADAQDVQAATGGDGAADACTQPLDAGQPFGGCPATFGDSSWKDAFCPLQSVGRVGEQTCTGYLLRQIDLGTHGWMCFYDPATQALLAGKFADDVPSFCDYRSSTVTFGSVPDAGSCTGPLTTMTDPCANPPG